MEMRKLQRRHFRPPQAASEYPSKSPPPAGLRSSPCEATAQQATAHDANIRTRVNCRPLGAAEGAVDPLSKESNLRELRAAAAHIKAHASQSEQREQDRRRNRSRGRDRGVRVLRDVDAVLNGSCGRPERHCDNSVQGKPRRHQVVRETKSTNRYSDEDSGEGEH